MTARLGRRTLKDAIEAGSADAIAVATGLKIGTVKRKLSNVHGATLVRNAFQDSWPVDGARLGALTVAFGRDEGFHEEIAGASGLSERTVTTRLNAQSGNKLLSNAFPEMAPAATETADTPSRGAGSGREKSGEPSEALRRRRVSDFREDSVLLSELFVLLQLPVGQIKRRLEKANGNMLIGNLFESEWPGSSGEPPVTTSRGDSSETSSNSSAGPSSQGAIYAGRWRVVRELGQGGMGTAYEVRDERNPQHGNAVLKVANDANSVKRLRAEIGLALELQHQHICAYRDIGEDDVYGTFIVMQHGGRSLENYIETAGPIALDVALEVVKQAALGIDYAHEHQVLHQDIKPGNILVRERPGGKLEVRISDFGIALRGRLTATHGGSNTVIARPEGFSPYFASPEQLAGGRVSRKSDQYSLALTLCAMLEGRIFGSRYAHRPLPRISSRQNQAIARALQEEPSRRFSSCTEFFEELRR